MVPKIRHAIMWSYEVWSKLDAHINRDCWRMARIYLVTWDVALVDKREKNRLQEELDELGALISKLQLGDDSCQSRLTLKYKEKRLLS